MSNQLPPHARPYFHTLLHLTRTRHTTASTSAAFSLHCHLIKLNLLSYTPIANSVLNFYSKSSLSSHALIAFSEITHKDTVSYNSLVNAPQFSNSNTFPLLRTMLANQIYPNARTFAGIFTSVAALEHPVGPAEQAHCVAIKFGDYENVFVGSAAVNMYCKIGDLSSARKVFDKMPKRNSVSWAVMISGYAIRRLANQAFFMFNLMMRLGEMGVNEFILTSVLSALTLPDLVTIGRQIHCLTVKNGLLGIISVGNAIVTMYGKCGALEDSVRTFELLGDKNAITWSAMITGFAQSGDSEKALNLFSKMHFSKVPPSEYTLVGVLNACSDLGSARKGRQIHGYLVKLGFESQIYIMSALVDMYAKSSCIIDARRGFDYLKTPDIVLWTSMIGGYVQNGENEVALSLYCKMQASGILPNELTMTSVIKACSSLAALEQGKQVHARIIKYGFSLEVPVGSALTTMYAKCGCLDDGGLIFQRTPVRDVVSWNSMISGISQNGYGNEALELFEKMRLKGTKPDHVTFVNVLSACSHMGLVDRGWSYLKMMSNDFGLIPKLEHYACMVDVLSRAGRLTEAKDFIESINIDHGLCLWRILLSACRNYRDHVLGAYAGEKLMELGSQESSAYVLLSSIYTALGRREDVERVRKMMSLRGVNKEPGCSWIELKSQVHVFVVGDQLHPEIKEIRRELQILSKFVEDEGYWHPSDLISSEYESLVDEEIVSEEQAICC